MWIPALDPATTPSPTTGSGPAPGADPVTQLPGAPALPPATPDPAPPAEEPAEPAPTPGDLATIEEKLNALLEAAGLGIRVRLLGPLPEDPGKVVFRPGTPGEEEDAARTRHRHHRHGHRVRHRHRPADERHHGAATVTSPGDEVEREEGASAAPLPPGILARLVTVLSPPAPEGPARLA